MGSTISNIFQGPFATLREHCRLYLFGTHRREGRRPELRELLAHTKSMDANPTRRSPTSAGRLQPGSARKPNPRLREGCARCCGLARDMPHSPCETRGAWRRPPRRLRPRVRSGLAEMSVLLLCGGEPLDFRPTAARLPATRKPLEQTDEVLDLVRVRG